MKIFKKLLIICCFTLLFIINVKADETKYIIPSIQETKIDIIKDFINTDIYSNFIEDVRQGNFNRTINSVEYDFTDNYVIDIDFSNLNNYSFDVRFFRVNAIYSTRLDMKGYSVKFTVTFDNVTHEIVSRNFVSLNSGISYNMSYETNSDGNMNIYIGDINSTYPEFVDGTFLNSLDYTFLNGTYFDNGNALLQLNQGDYARGEQVPTKYFFDTLNSIFAPPNVNPNKCLIANQIGETRNISSLTFRVTGVTNALDFPLEGYFELQSNTFFDRVDILDYVSYVDVIVNDIQSDDEYDVEYNLEWIEGTSSDYLRLNYTITAIDDIDTNIDVSFTLKSKDSDFDIFFENLLLIYGCPPNNIYTNISYGYTDNDSGISYSSDSILSNFLQDQNLGNVSSLVNTDLIGDGPVDSILLLPLNIMRNLLNVLNTNTCQPLVLPLPNLNSNITLPCVNTLYNQINGLSTFLNWFSAIASAFILYEYFIRLYKWVDNLLTFRENNHFGGF